MQKKYMIFVLIFAVILHFTAPATASGDKATNSFSPNPLLSVHPKALSERIEIDGHLEDLWFENSSFNNFTEYEPTENRQPIVSTEGYITFDNKNLYIAFICQDPDISNLRASYADRDKIFDDDWVCVSIDPNRDQQKAYQLFANGRGIQGDKLFQSNGVEDESFDIVWQSEARISEHSWTVEMKVPFESLRFPNSGKQSWAIHFTRNYPRDDEFKFSWMPISQNNSSFMGQAGILDFEITKHDSKKRTMEILPYAIATQNNYRNGNSDAVQLSNWERERLDGRAGFGIKYGLSSNFIADIAFNPDFSQIESDAGQISINNPFALFFDEKRPFFKEGSDIYAVDHFTRGIVLDQFVNLFYSRSINNPLIAGKLSGKVGRLSVGYTSAYDQNTPYILPFEEGSTVLTTEKKSYNNIVRTKYDLGNQSHVGLFASDRRLDGTSGSNSVAAIDASIRLSDRYTASFIAALTHTLEPDDSELTDMIGGGTFKIGKTDKTTAFDGESYYGSLIRAKLQRASRHWNAAFAYQDFSPGFRADNGFIYSNNYRMMEGVTSYAFRFEDHNLFTSIEPRINGWRKFNYDGVIIDTGTSYNMPIIFRNQVTLRFGGFILNRENLRGKQFGDARSMWSSLRINKWNSIVPGFFARMGREINRMGVEGDSNNPFEIVPVRRGGIFVTLKPTSKISNDINYSGFKLWTNSRNDKIMEQHILRNSLSYQFNKKMFVRLIAEYSVVDYFSSSEARMVNQKNFALDPQVSYKLNAFSVFYLGAHFGARNNLYWDRETMRFDNQSIYAKFQYLFKR
jgi:hypothetical protein